MLLVIDDLPARRFERHALLRPVEEAAKKSFLEQRGSAVPYLSYLVKTRSEAAYHSPLYLDMTEDAVLVTDRADFFSGVLEAMRARMKELGSHRVWLGKGWYWILKPEMRYGERVEI